MTFQPCLCSKPFGAHLPYRRMLTAIEFDHELILGAGEVDDVVPNRVLSAKFVLQETPTAQCRPHAPFGIGRSLPQSAGFVVGHEWTLSTLGK